MDSVKAKQYSNHLEFGDISKTIKQVVESNEWSILQESFNNCYQSITIEIIISKIFFDAIYIKTFSF